MSLKSAIPKYEVVKKFFSKNNNLEYNNKEENIEKVK